MAHKQEQMISCRNDDMRRLIKLVINCPTGPCLPMSMSVKNTQLVLDRPYHLEASLFILTLVPRLNWC